MKKVKKTKKTKKGFNKKAFEKTKAKVFGMKEDMGKM
jgi:hypothetical protein